jgi:hypothetical protein
MKRIVVITIVVLLGVAYLAGYWPEHSQLKTARTTLDELQPQLANAEVQVRLGQVLGQQMRLADAITVRNFGEATDLSTAFFDRVQQEAARTTNADARQALDTILQTRDQVTTAIARTDLSVGETLRQQEIVLRRALGYPVPAQEPLPVPVTLPAPAPPMAAPPAAAPVQAPPPTN